MDPIDRTQRFLDRVADGERPRESDWWKLRPDSPRASFYTCRYRKNVGGVLVELWSTGGGWWTIEVGGHWVGKVRGLEVARARWREIAVATLNDALVRVAMARPPQNVCPECQGENHHHAADCKVFLAETMEGDVE